MVKEIGGTNVNMKQKSKEYITMIFSVFLYFNHSKQRPLFFIAEIFYLCTGLRLSGLIEAVQMFLLAPVELLQVAYEFITLSK